MSDTVTRGPSSPLRPGSAGTMRDRASELRSKLERADRARREAGAALSELTVRNASETTQLKSDLAAVLRQRDAAESRRREAVNDAALLRKLNNDALTRTDMVRQKAAQEVAALNKALQLEQKICTDLEVKRGRLQERQDSLDGQVSALQADLATVVSERDDAVKDAAREAGAAVAADKRLIELRTVNAELRQRVDATEAARASEARDAARRLRSLEAGIASLKAKLAETAAARAVAETRCSQQEAELVKLRQIRAEMETTRGQLRSEVTTLKKEMQTLTNTRL